MDTHIEHVVAQAIDEINDELRDISLKIHDDPETSNEEFHAHALLTGYLEKKGFTVTRSVAGLDTAFLAEYSNSSQGRRLGFCSEYDALPGVGHGCGHNLIAISGVASAVAIKALLERKLIQGKVVLFGTPAEETTEGKVVLVKNGEFQKRVDFALMLHPYPYDVNYCNMLALDGATVEFFGKATHAGMKPWDGINALDAFMQAWNNVSMLRQQTLTSNRIHGIILEGGKSANVIPDYVSGKFIARSLKYEQLVELKQKLENCFQSAANATGCKLKITWDPNGAVKDVFMNDTLTDIYREYMEKENVEFLPRSEEEKILTGSTDFGNVTRILPATHPHFGIGIDAPIHSVDFMKAARTEKAHVNTIRAARCVAKAAAKVLVDDALYEQMLSDFKKGKK
ncbi:hypothetical protein BDB00DRAFT_465354 [Zychaea mexicana]|uniref:uncharacterized protein n=1 Tax=Zychaea mexicana TaxID=64656 RepID=UPI0022FDD791|nr:uncharacterized protein BDB00DRAFT_465354 [Zychaea mexicana]KAI9492005.1 hypothetical protein BDB00DRAFT_465354 [Zychaea mexicana]